MWSYPREACGTPAQHGAELPRASKRLLPTHGRDAYIDAYSDALRWHGIVNKGTCGKRKILLRHAFTNAKGFEHRGVKESPNLPQSSFFDRRSSLSLTVVISF